MTATKIHAEMSFIKVNNYGVKRDSVKPLLLNVIGDLILTYISNKAESVTGSRQYFFDKKW